MRWVSEAFRLYKKQFKKIFLISLILIFPLEIFNLFLANYFGKLFEIMGIDAVAAFYINFFNLIFLTIFQLPFALLAFRDAQNESYSWGSIIANTLEIAFPVYVMGVLYALAVSIGSFIIIIPGLLLMILLFPIPYVAAIENNLWFKGLKSSFSFAKQNFFGLLGIVLLFQFIEWAVEYLVLILTGSLIGDFAIVSLIQIILNMLFLPFFSFVVANYYIEKADVLS